MGVLLVWLMGLAAPSLAAPAAASTPAGRPAPEVLRYGVLAAFPPFQVWPAGSKPGGADVELVREWAAAAGLLVEPVRYTDFSALEADLLAGRIHLASSMARTAAREAGLRFLPSYVQVPLALVTRAERPSAALLPDLAGRSVAVVRGYASSEQADRLFPLASRVLVSDLAEGLRAVQSGRADVLLEALPPVADLIERERLKDLVIARRVEAPSGRLHLVLHPSQALAADALQRALAAYPAGRVDSLVQAWSVLPAPPALPDWAPSEAERARLQAWAAPVIGIVGREPSFAAFDAEGRPTGLSVELLRALLQRLGVQPARFVPLSAAELPQALLQGRVDLVLGADEGADRSPLLRFVGPFIEYPTVLIGRPESGAFDLEQLSGRRLALTANSPARPLVDSRHPGIEVVTCDDVPDCIERVVAGQAEATLADVVTAALALAQTPRPQVQMIGSEPRLRRFHSVGVAERHAALVPLIKQALDVAVAHDLPQLKARWFARPAARDVVHALLRQWAPPVAAGLLLLLVGWLWHSARLRAEVGRTRIAQAEAEVQAEHQRRFTAVLAHEVRNALHGVVAGVELLRPTLARVPAAPGTAPGLPPAELGAQLADSAQGTLRLLNDLIDRERLHQGRLALREGSAAVAPLLQAVADGLAAAASLRGQTFTLSLPTAAPPLWLDGLRLQQLVRNLLANAVKYAGPGEIELAADVRPAAGDGLARLWVEVRDRGPGLPAPGSGALASDSGLGLALCHELAALMHARLSLEPRSGGGLLARVELELRPLPHETPTEPRPTPVSTVGPLRVLVVEDAAAYALLLQRAFELEGHRVQLVGRIDAACAALAAEPAPQLVLSDLHLDGDDVMPLLDRWRAQPPQRRPRLVLMTADLETLPAALDPARTGVPVLEKRADVRELLAAALALANAPADV